MLPLLVWAQHSIEPTRTSFIIDGVAVDEDKLCSLDELSSDSARIVISRLFPDILPAYIANITVKPDSTDANSIVEIKTAPQRSFLILIDGEPYELSGMTFGIWLNDDERGKYLQSFLSNHGITSNDVSDAVYIKTEGVVRCNNPLPTILIVTKQKECDTVYIKSGAEPITNNLAKIVLNSINLWQENCKRQVRDGVCIRDTTQFLISSIGLPSEVIFNLPSNTKYVYDVSYGNELYKQVRKNKNHSIGYTKINIELVENNIEISFFSQVAVAKKRGKRQWWEISSSEYDAIFTYS